MKKNKKQTKQFPRAISSFATTSDNITILRLRPKKRITKKWPFGLQEHNKFMGMRRNDFTHYPRGLKSQKWYFQTDFKAELALALILNFLQKKRGQPNQEADIASANRIGNLNPGDHIRYNDGHWATQTRHIVYQ